jgi:hypothetical protein
MLKCYKYLIRQNFSFSIYAQIMDVVEVAAGVADGLPHAHDDACNGGDDNGGGDNDVAYPAVQQQRLKNQVQPKPALLQKL